MTFVIGDVHGCYHELIELVIKAKIDSTVDVVFVGDLIDKGPNSQDVCAEAFEDLPKIAKTVTVLRGNHEHKMGKYHQHVLKKEKTPSYKIPTKTTPEFLKEYESVGKWVGRFSDLPMFMDIGNFRIVHAGPADLQNPNTVNDRMLYMRYIHKDTHEFLPLVDMKRPENSIEWYEAYFGEKIIVFGHITRDEPVLRPNALGIDTGCVHGGHLTGIWMETKEVVQVKAAKQYSRHMVE